MKKLNGEFLNEKPFSHVCRNGIEFRAERCDFKGGIQIILDSDFRNNFDEELSIRLMKATAEMVGFHATNIWEYLNGFQGYDCVDYEIIYE